MSKKDKGAPKWLRTIQLNSWEAELLISALVLYALFQIPDFIRSYSLQNIPKGSQLYGFFGILASSIKLLRVGYILHILVRGIWVSSVGLSYVFPKGIKEKSLNFKGKFKTELESNHSLINNVLKLEQLSSMIYGISFLMFGSLLGFGVLTFLFVFLSYITPNQLGSSFSGLVAIPIVLLTIVYFFGLLFLFVDFLTNGFFRRKNWSAKWFYPVARVFRVLSLSFLYRRSLLVIISNVEGWKRRLIPFAILIAIAFFVLLSKEVRENKMSLYFERNQVVNTLKTNYESQRDNKDFLLATIQSDIVSENTLRLFVRDISLFKSIYKSQKRSTQSFPELEWEELPADTTSMLLNKWLSVKIDKKEIPNNYWFPAQHPKTYAHGFTSYVNISQLTAGSHNVSLTIDSTSFSDRSQQVLLESEYNYPYLSNIHFICDK